MNMQPIIPYLTLNGNATEAMSFYKNAFLGEIVFSQTFAEAPMEIPEGNGHKIMHAKLQAGELVLLFSDTLPGQETVGGTNLSLSMDFKSLEEIERTYNALTDGATISMPLQDTFWGAKFGILVDKYGIQWMFNHDYESVKDEGVEV